MDDDPSGNGTEQIPFYYAEVPGVFLINKYSEVSVLSYKPYL